MTVDLPEATGPGIVRPSTAPEITNVRRLSPAAFGLLSLVVLLSALLPFFLFEIGLLLLGSLVLCGCLRRPDVFVLALLTYIPFEEFLLKWVPGSLYAPLRYAPELLLLAVLATQVVLRTLRGTLWRRTALDLPLAVFLLVAFASAQVNDVSPMIALLGLKNLLRYVVLYYVIVHSAPSERMIHRIIHVLLATAVLQTLIGLVQSAFGAPAFHFLNAQDVVIGNTTIRNASALITMGSRITGTMARYNHFGTFVAFFALVALAFWYHSRRRVYLTLLPLLILGIVLSFSRMSWVGLGFGITVLAWLFRRRIQLALFLGTALVLAGIALGPGSGVKRMQGEQTESIRLRLLGMLSSDYALRSLETDRLFAYFVTAPLVLEHWPWLGLGPGTIGSEVTGGGTNSPGLYPEASHADWLGLPDESLQYTHDAGWVALLAQVGLLGLGAFLWLCWRALRPCWLLHCRAPRGLAAAIGTAGFVALLTVLLENFFSFNLTYRAMSSYFWAFAAFGHSLAHPTQ